MLPPQEARSGQPRSCGLPCQQRVLRRPDGHPL